MPTLFFKLRRQGYRTMKVRELLFEVAGATLLLRQDETSCEPED